MAIEPWDAGAPPGSSQLAVGACFVLVALFFGIRAHLFGDVWHVNRTDGSAPTLQHTWRAAVSALPWWHGLTRETPAAAMLYLALLPAAGATAKAQAAVPARFARLASAGRATVSFASQLSPSTTCARWHAIGEDSAVPCGCRRVAATVRARYGAVARALRLLVFASAAHRRVRSPRPAGRMQWTRAVRAAFERCRSAE